METASMTLCGHKYNILLETRKAQDVVDFVKLIFTSNFSVCY